MKPLTLGQAPNHTQKHQARLEVLVEDKQSSLLRKFVNCGQKSFITSGPGQVERSDAFPNGNKKMVCGIKHPGKFDIVTMKFIHSAA